MNESVPDFPVLSSEKTSSSILIKAGGFFGIVGSTLGLALLLIGCAGFGNAMKASPVAVGCGAFGIFLTILGAFFQKRSIGEDTHVLQALFACLIAILGGVLEMAVWFKWPVFK